MDIEWAVDGLTKELFIVQARPETVHSRKKSHTLTEYVFKRLGLTKMRLSTYALKEGVLSEMMQNV